MTRKTLWGFVFVLALEGCVSVNFDDVDSSGSWDSTPNDTNDSSSGGDTQEPETNPTDTTGDSSSSSSDPFESETGKSSDSFSDTEEPSDSQTVDTDSSCMPPCGAGKYCDQGTCKDCLESAHCGSSCGSCPSTQPVCDGDAVASAQCICQLSTCATGTYCDAVTGGCQPCTVDDHCGSTCAKCSGDTPECQVEIAGDPSSSGCGCMATSDCDIGKWCDTSSGKGQCIACGVGPVNNAHCGESCTNCDVAGGSCDSQGKCSCSLPGECNSGSTCDDGSCVICNQDAFCGLSCEDCTQNAQKPYCNGSMCVECTGNEHCTPPEVCHMGTGMCISCQGTQVGGYCWYKGTVNQSCAAVCATHGGYSEATKTYAGSEGTSENCKAVLDAVRGASTNMASSVPSGLEAAGCMWWPAAGLGMRGTSSPTTDTASATFIERVCACNN